MPSVIRFFGGGAQYACFVWCERVVWPRGKRPCRINGLRLPAIKYASAEAAHVVHNALHLFGDGAQDACFVWRGLSGGSGEDGDGGAGAAWAEWRRQWRHWLRIGLRK